MSNNPILASQLYKDDGAIKAGIADLREFKQEYIDAIKAIKKEIPGLEASVKGLGAMSSAQRDTVLQTTKQLEKMATDISSYKAKIKDLEKTIKEFENSTKKTGGGRKVQNDLEKGSLADLKNQYKENSLALSKLSETTIQTTRAGYQLKESNDRLKASIDAKTKATKQEIDVIKLERIALGAKVGSYNQLSAQYSLLKIKLNGLTEEERTATVQGQKMERQANAIYAQMNKLQEATGKYTLNVGNYKGAIAPLLAKQQQLVNQLERMEAEFKSLPIHVQKSAQAQKYHGQAVAELRGQIQQLEATTGRQISTNQNLEKSNTSLWQSAKQLLGVYLGFSAIKGIGSNILGQTTQLSSLDNAYSKIIKDSDELGQTQTYLKRLADSYGASIFQLKSQYLKYTASVVGSNIPLSEQQYIFEAITKASAVLGLSTEEQGRAFTALQQIMSKGVVSAEELKGQLGDVLPGAVNIMARALGIGTAELFKMQEQGKVLAEDAMPKFARELEKTYGVESSAKINNVAAAQGRFQTAITETIAKLEASDAIKAMYETMEAGVKIIGDNINLIYNLLKAVTALAIAYGTYKLTVVAVTLAERIRGGSLVAYAAAQTGVTVATNASAIATLALNAALKLNPMGVLITVITAVISLLGLFTDKLDGIGTLFGTTSKDAVQGYLDEKKNLESLIEAAKRNNDNQEVRKVLYDQIKAKYPEYLKNIDLEKEGIAGLNKLLIEYNNVNTLASAKESVRLQNVLELQKEKQSILLNIAKIEARPNADNFFNRAAVKAYGKDLDAVEKKLKALDVTGSTNRGGSFLHKDTQPDEKPKNLSQKEIDAAKKAAEEKEKLAKQAIENEFKRRELNINALEDGYEKELQLLILNNDKKKIEFKEVGADLLKLEESFYKQKKALKERFILQDAKSAIDALPDGNKKDLALLEFNFEQQREMYERLKIDTNGLEANYQKERAAIIDKANEEELAKADKQVTDRIALMEDGLAKQKAELNHEYEVKKRSTEDLVELEAWYKRQLKKLENESADKKVDAELEIFEKKQTILKNEFEAVKHTEKEKADFAIKQEIAKLKKILELNKQFNGTMDLLGKQLIASQIALLDSQLKGKGEGKDIFDLLGITGLDGDQKKAISEALDFAYGQLADYAAKRTEIANQNVEQRNQEVNEAQKALDSEKDALRDGYSASVTDAQKRLDLAKKQQKDALNERAKAQKAEIALQAVAQASNLITASSKIWATLGFPWALPAIALMWGSFALSKVKAFQAVKTYGKGGYERFDHGGAHGSGRDFPIGVNSEGQTMIAEKGEGQAIYTRRAVAKYGNKALRQITNSINNLSFGNAEIKPAVTGINIMQPIYPKQDFAFNTDVMEGHLATLVKNSETKFTNDGNGLVKVRKNVTTYYGRP